MLISYLTKWLGVRLITLDIHGGTTEEDIVNVFKEAEAYLSGPAAGDVYIFLDEVNTCAHMGVIAEAIGHRTINGIRLPESIKIMAALNPYRMKPDMSDTADGEVGLSYSNPSSTKSSRAARKGRTKAAEDPMKRLVYRVHPIPRLLQDFIFDFGCKFIISYCAFLLRFLLL